MSLRFFTEGVGLRQLGKSARGEQDGSAIGMSHHMRWHARMLGDHRGRDNAMVELREWISPRYTGRPYVIPHHTGINRLTFQVPDVHLLYEHIRGSGHFCFSTPMTAKDEFRDLFSDCYFCCRSPDAMKIEFVQSAAKEAQIAWVDLNCTDIARSLEWYQQHLGMQQTVPLKRFSMDGRFCGIKAPVDVSMALLHLPKQQDRFGLRLLQWHSPMTRGKPYETMNNLGLYLIAMQVKNVKACYEKLRQNGVECRSAPLQLDVGEETRSRLEKVLFFDDPEGICLQLIEQPAAGKTA